MSLYDRHEMVRALQQAQLQRDRLRRILREIVEELNEGREINQDLKERACAVLKEQA